MNPVILKWKRALGGVKTVEAEAVTFVNRTATKLFVWSGEGFEEYEVKVTDLENPLALMFINAWREKKLAAFLSKFGLLRHQPMYDADVELTAEELAMRLVYSTNHDAMKQNVRWVNTLLEHTALKVSFDWNDDAPTGRLVLRPDTLLDFMALEIALAHEVGAVTTECEHCGKVYLTGPLTARRSHSKFCADRCRVAAARRRTKTSKERAIDNVG